MAKRIPCLCAMECKAGQSIEMPLNSVSLTLRASKTATSLVLSTASEAWPRKASSRARRLSFSGRIIGVSRWCPRKRRCRRSSLSSRKVCIMGTRAGEKNAVPTSLLARRKAGWSGLLSVSKKSSMPCSIEDGDPPHIKHDSMEPVWTPKPLGQGVTGDVRIDGVPQPDVFWAFCVQLQPSGFGVGEVEPRSEKLDPGRGKALFAKKTNEIMRHRVSLDDSFGHVVAVHRALVRRAGRRHATSCLPRCVKIA